MRPNRTNQKVASPGATKLMTDLVACIGFSLVRVLRNRVAYYACKIPKASTVLSDEGAEMATSGEEL